MKILLIDIETAPNLAFVWGLWQQNVGISQIQAAGYTMCFAARWYGQKDIIFDSVKKSGAKRMLKHVHKLLSEADVVITYNGDKFDLPTLNKEFIQLEMLPPAPYKSLDLYKTAKTKFRFASNKLDYLGKALNIGQKVKHAGMDLWIQCMAGQEDAWKDMERYNRHDVVLLQLVYERMRPWLNHPNHGTYDEPGIPVCPNCGSGHLQRRGFARTIVQKYPRYQCCDCGAWSRGTDGELPREDRAVIQRRIT